MSNQAKDINGKAERDMARSGYKGPQQAASDAAEEPNLEQLSVITDERLAALERKHKTHRVITDNYGDIIGKLLRRMDAVEEYQKP